MRHDFHGSPFDEATQVKLEIFRRYVREWISVLLTRSNRQFSQLGIYDFFTGPGQDSANHPGSPLIIIDEVKEFCRNRKTVKANIPVRLVFNDVNNDHITALEQAVSKVRCPESCCHFEFSSASFEHALPQHLPRMREKGQANLVLMDQFGVKEVTPEIVKTLLDCQSTDILFFISSSFIRRFIDTQEIQARFKLDPRTTKDVEYKAIHRFMCEYFRSALGNRGALIAPFSIKKGSNIYGVIFATGHRLGMEKFLKVCWDLDPATGEANYSVDGDPAWEGEKFLLPGMNAITRIEFFRQALIDHIRKASPTNVELYEFCLEQGFCAKKANEVLRNLQQDGSIAVTDIGKDQPARQGSFYLSEDSVRAQFKGR